MDYIKIALSVGAEEHTAITTSSDKTLLMFNSKQLAAFAEAVIREREREQCDAVVPSKEPK